MVTDTEDIFTGIENYRITEQENLQNRKFKQNLKFKSTVTVRLYDLSTHEKNMKKQCYRTILNRKKQNTIDLFAGLD